MIFLIISKREDASKKCRKLLLACPICGKLIYEEDLKLNSRIIDNWPIYHVFKECTIKNSIPEHQLELFIDANHEVRSLKVIRI